MGTLLHPSPQRKQGNTAGVTGWDERRHRFDVFVSQLVFEEASAGDPKAAAERVKLLEGLRFIRSIREKMLAECGGKPEEFFRRLREGERLQAAAGREFVDGPVATATQASPARSSPPPPAA